MSSSHRPTRLKVNTSLAGTLAHSLSVFATKKYTRVWMYTAVCSDRRREKQPIKAEKSHKAWIELTPNLTQQTVVCSAGLLRAATHNDVIYATAVRCINTNNAFVWSPWKLHHSQMDISTSNGKGHEFVNLKKKKPIESLIKRNAVFNIHLD